MKSMLLVLVALFSGVAFGEPQVAPKIRLPAQKVSSDKPIKMTAETMFVVDSDVELVILPVPNGHVKTTADTGPLRIRGKFAEGEDKVETKTFTGKYVYIIEAAVKGKAELIIVPTGLKNESEVIRRTVEIVDGTAPQPPPPGPEPEPNPKPKPIPSGGPFYIAVIRDPGQVSPQQATLFSDTEFWDGLKTGGSDWDFYANTSKDAEKKNYLALAKEVQGGSATYVATLIVLEKDTGKKVLVAKLPNTKDEVLKLISGVSK